MLRGRLCLKTVEALRQALEVLLLKVKSGLHAQLQAVQPGDEVMWIGLRLWLSDRRWLWLWIWLDLSWLLLVCLKLLLHGSPWIRHVVRRGCCDVKEIVSVGVTTQHPHLKQCLSADSDHGDRGRSS